MGGGSWKASDWSTYKSTHIDNKKSVTDIYAKSMASDLNVRNIKFRESRDSADHPISNAVIVGVDVTGSMGSIAELIARNGLKTLAEEMYAKKPVVGPHLLFMGIGDVESDRAPVQATQFESDIRIAEQLTKIYLEGNGGGNGYESYIAAWYFGALKTQLDCYEKRGEKGFLFTLGDEPPTPYLLKEHILEFFGDTIQSDRYTAQQLLTLVSKYYNVYHIIIKEGSHCRHGFDGVKRQWNDLLGERAIVLDDYTKLSELIVSTIQLSKGVKLDNVVAGWDGSTGLVIRKALSNLPQNVNAVNGLIRF